MSEDLSHRYPHTGEAKPFLCLIGIHRKKHLGITLMGDSMYECEKCRRRWLVMLIGATFYEDMPPQGWPHQ